MGFQIHGDSEILRYIYRYRFLQTKLLSLLTERSEPVIRRRLRALKKLGYLIDYERRVTEEAVYALSRRGLQFVADDFGLEVQDLPMPKDNSRLPEHLRLHAMEMVRFAVKADLGLEAHPQLSPLAFYPECYFQNSKAKLAEDRYLVKERVSVNGMESLPCHPDALLLADYGNNQSVAFYIETDRGTENLQRIETKIRAYNALFQQNLFRKRFGASTMVVLFVLGRVKTKRRVRNIQTVLRKFAEDLGDPEGVNEASIVRRILTTTLDQVSIQSVWNEAIWTSWQDEQKALYKPKGREGEREEKPVLTSDTAIVRTIERAIPDDGMVSGRSDGLG